MIYNLKYTFTVIFKICYIIILIACVMFLENVKLQAFSVMVGDRIYSV